MGHNNPTPIHPGTGSPTPTAAPTRPGRRHAAILSHSAPPTLNSKRQREPGPGHEDRRGTTPPKNLRRRTGRSKPATTPRATNESSPRKPPNLAYLRTVRPGCRSTLVQARVAPPPAISSPGRTVLDDPAALDHQHPVGDLDRRQPVGDDERGPVGEDRPQRALHQPLRRDVERRRRLVEDQHRRVGQERAGERDQLPLPGRQPTAALADVGVVAVGQRADERVARRSPRPPPRSRPAVASGPAEARCSPRSCRRTGSSPGSP